MPLAVTMPAAAGRLVGRHSLKTLAFILRLALGAAYTCSAQTESSVHMRTTRADQYRVTYWTSEQGLPQNTANALLQTRDGYLWIGTRYGLARFDGLRLTAFVNELSVLDPETLNVRGLAEDARGQLWLNSWEHLLCFQEGRFTAVSLDAAPFPGRIQHICAAREGGLWVAKVHGLFHFIDGKVDRAFSVKDVTGSLLGGDAEIERVFLGTQDRLWVKSSCYAGRVMVWHRLNPQSGTVEALNEMTGLGVTDIGAVIEDRSGRLWAGRPGELMRWDGGLSRFATDDAPGNRSVEALAEDLQGSIWIVSRGPQPLRRFRDDRFTSFGRAEGISDPDDLRCVLPDREGNVWVGSGAGGLYRLQPRSVVSLLTGSYFAMDEVYSVAPGRDGRVWLATTYGLVDFHNGQFVVHTNQSGMGNSGSIQRVRPVLEDSSGEVWCGLDHHGLQTLRDGVITPVDSPAIGGTARRRVQGMLEDRARSLWITTQQGLWQRHAGGYRLWTTKDGLADNEVSGLAEGPEGSLWVGSERGGIHQLKEGRIRRYATPDGLLHDNAWPLRAEPDGTVWVGTPNGVNRIRGDEVRAVTMQEGLFDNLAYALLEDRRSNYWTFGNRGIWRMKKADLNAVADGRADRVFCVSYGEADGMGSSEGNGDQQPNAVALPNGELWFPTTRGVVIVNPEKLRDNEVPPGVVIEEVRVDEETVFKDGGLVKPETRNPKSETSSKSEVRKTRIAADARVPTSIQLPPGRARVLEIRYTANTFIDPEKARFRFRLEGHDQDWREADSRRQAFYTNLRPGSYRFRVEACNHHGYWSTTPAEFAFSLAPHFYQTWPFFALCVLAAIGTGLGWHSHRMRSRQRLHEFRQQQALSEERSRIAKDLHDDLGANLTGIGMQIEVARQQLSQQEAAQQDLEDIAGAVRGLAGQMREVVWSLSPQCDTLESFCTYVCDYVEGFLRTAGLRCRLDIPERLPDRALSAETRHHLLLVVKEALNNVARHAVASEVHLRLRTSEDGLLVTIADNGRGFQANPAPRPGCDRSAQGDLANLTAGTLHSGRGLDNMHRRVAALGGSFTIQSELGLGTHLTIHVPLRRLE